jgi:hypothetical protein
LQETGFAIFGHECLLEKSFVQAAQQDVVDTKFLIQRVDAVFKLQFERGEEMLASAAGS